MNKRLLGSAAIFVALILLYAGKLLSDAGAFKHVVPHFSGHCKSIPDMVGVEDMQIDLATETLYMTSDSRPDVGAVEDPHRPMGSIWSLDLKSLGAKPLRLTPAVTDFAFHPHGMGLWRAESGLRLFVVNHAVGDAVEIFVVGEPSGLLRHERTITDPALVTANDVAPTGVDTFFVTNDHGSTSHWLQDVESFTRLGRGNLLYFDGKKFTRVLDRLDFANGVRISGDGKMLFLAETLKRSVQVYRIPEGPVSELQFVKSIFLGTAPDNIDIDAEGSLWIGTHPNLFRLKAISRDHHELSPAQIVRVQDPLGTTPKVEEIYLNDGRPVSAASVGVRTGSRLFIGSIYDDKILDCQM